MEMCPQHMFERYHGYQRNLMVVYCHRLHWCFGHCTSSSYSFFEYWACFYSLVEMEDMNLNLVGPLEGGRVYH